MPHGTNYIQLLPFHVVFLLRKQITEYHATLQLFTPLRVFIHPLTTTGDRFLQIRENQWTRNIF